eukprot:scpid86552/ scgid14712/ 
MAFSALIGLALLAILQPAYSKFELNRIPSRTCFGQTVLSIKVAYMVNCITKCADSGKLDIKLDITKRYFNLTKCQAILECRPMERQCRPGFVDNVGQDLFICAQSAQETYCGQSDDNGGLLIPSLKATSSRSCRGHQKLYYVNNDQDSEGRSAKQSQNACYQRLLSVPPSSLKGCMVETMKAILVAEYWSCLGSSVSPNWENWPTCYGNLETSLQTTNALIDDPETNPGQALYTNGNIQAAELFSLTICV